MSDASHRLLALVTDAYGGRGGIAAFNRALIEALVSTEGVGAVDVVPRLVIDEPEGSPDGVVVATAATGGAVRYLVEAARFGSKAEGVVCGHLHLVPLAALVAAARGVPLVLILHGIEAWAPPHDGLRGAALRAGLRRVDTYVAVSDCTRRRFEAWAPVDPARGRVVPNTFEPGPFTPGPYPAKLASRYGLEGRKVVMTLGRLAGLARRKGFDVVLKALPALATRVPEVAYLIAGDGPDRARLEAKAEALGVADRVVFTGYVPEDEKADHYRLADCFAMPSRGEGFGIVLLEAMACGTPVVASRSDGSLEAVRGGLLAPAVDPADSDAVVAALVEALGRPRGVPGGLEYFSASRFADRWHGVVSETFS